MRSLKSLRMMCGSGKGEVNEIFWSIRMELFHFWCSVRGSEIMRGH